MRPLPRKQRMATALPLDVPLAPSQLPSVRLRNGRPRMHSSRRSAAPEHEQQRRGIRRCTTLDRRAPHYVGALEQVRPRYFRSATAHTRAEPEQVHSALGRRALSGVRPVGGVASAPDLRRGASPSLTMPQMSPTQRTLPDVDPSASRADDADGALLARLLQEEIEEAWRGSPLGADGRETHDPSPHGSEAARDLVPPRRAAGWWRSWPSDLHVIPLLITGSLSRACRPIWPAGAAEGRPRRDARSKPFALRGGASLGGARPAPAPATTRPSPSLVRRNGNAAARWPSFALVTGPGGCAAPARRRRSPASRSPTCAP